MLGGFSGSDREIVPVSLRSGVNLPPSGYDRHVLKRHETVHVPSGRSRSSLGSLLNARPLGHTYRASRNSRTSFYRT
jgi:hypothetical protein